MVNASCLNSRGIRPSINLKADVKIVNGSGTEDDPYRLLGDNDTNLNGAKLNTRYSGEYIRFGTGENNLYQIVSHETTGLTKITSAGPLKSSGSFITSAFGSNVTFSSTNTVGSFLNNDYLSEDNGYLTNEQVNMIEDNSTWYLGTVGDGDSYKLTKYTNGISNILTLSTTNAKVGLLRLGELMAGQFDRNGSNTTYWVLTPYSETYVRRIDYYGYINYNTPASVYGVQPSMNLKSNVIITSGDGTKENPFNVVLA